MCCGVISLALYGICVYSYIYVTTGSHIDYGDDSWRIAVTDSQGNELYYDMKGNTYSDPYAVKLYDREGEEYVYTEKKSFGKSEIYYTNTAGEKYDYLNCYVDSEGYFHYDDDASIFFDEDFKKPEGVSISEFEYYELKSFDEQGNVYYSADSASWNENGELITEENDINR